MDKPSKTFSKAGFYLILIFTFFAPISPTIAHIAVFMASALWIIEQLIFRNTDWVNDEMFVPVAGFILFTLLAFIVSRISLSASAYTYTGYLAIFYFVVQRFVSFSEKRKMIIWTFIAGVVISYTIDTIISFSGAGFGRTMVDLASQEISFFILFAFAMILAFYAEGRSAGEKLFFGLIALPLVGITVLTLNIYVIIILLFLLLIIGVFKDRTAFIPLVIFSILIFSGIFDFYSRFSPTESFNVFKATFANFAENFRVTENISFFGMIDTANIPGIDTRINSFFLKLLVTSGPPALMFLLWILLKQFRNDLVKIRKTAYSEMKYFHLGIALTVISFVMLSLFGSIFQSSSAVLVFWMILGMSEI